MLTLTKKCFGRPGPGRILTRGDMTQSDFEIRSSILRNIPFSTKMVVDQGSFSRFGLNLIACCELERDTQTANFALLQIDWCGPAPCLRRMLLLVCCSVAFEV